MKNRYFLILALLGLALPAAAQKWVPISDVAPATLRGVFFTDAATGFVAGDGGVILKTTDSGATWRKQNSGTTQNILDVLFTDPNTGYCVGAAGTLLKTTNAGVTWAALNAGVAGQLSALSFPDATTGYAVGTSGTILKTTNAGAAWTAQISNTTWNLNSVHFVNASTGFAVGTAGTVLKTTNGGSTWTAQNSTVGTNLRSVHFLDLNNGYIAGAGGTVLKTTNGGTTWTATNCCSSSSYTYTKVRMSSLTSIFLTSAEGINYYTTNGTTWAGENLGDIGTQSFFFVNANTGFMAGRDGTIMKTQNGPSQWRRLNGPLQYSILTPAPNTVYAIGHHLSLRSLDGGNTWSSTLFTNRMYDAHFASATVGYAVGEEGKIIKTTNGTDWVTLNSGTTGSLWAIFAVDADNVYATHGTNILKTTNGGSLWLSLPTGSTANLQDLFFLNVSTGFAVGNNGTILKTTDGGANWTKLASGTTGSLDNVYFADANTGYAIGSSGIILKTTNGGTTWSQQVSPVTNTTFQKISFLNANLGYITGNGGLVLRTVDGGANWVKQQTGLTGNLYGIGFADASTGYVSEHWKSLCKYVSVPQITVRQTTALVPGSAVAYGFVDTHTGLASAPVTYTVENTGDLPLNLTGTPVVTVTGANAADFVLNTQTTTATLGSGASTTFTLVFKPSADGVRTATVSIPTNDPDQPVYSFNVSGTGITGPEISVRQGTTYLPKHADASAFGTVKAGAPKTLTYTIENLGNEPLVLTGKPSIGSTASGENDYSINFPGNGGTIPTGGSLDFTITFDPTAPGERWASIAVRSNDADEGTDYWLRVKGEGIVEAPTVQAQQITFAPTAKDNEIKINWTNGNGRERLVVIRENGVPARPVDLKIYHFSPYFGSGADLGEGSYAVYQGTDSTVTVQGLKTNSYTVAVYELLGKDHNQKFNPNAASGNPATRMITSVADPATVVPFRVLPNPVGEQLRILAADIPVRTPMQLYVYTANGRTLLEARGEVAQLEQAVNGQLKHLAPGLYFIKLQSKYKSYLTRFVKQ